MGHELTIGWLGLMALIQLANVLIQESGSTRAVYLLFALINLTLVASNLGLILQ